MPKQSVWYDGSIANCIVSHVRADLHVLRDASSQGKRVREVIKLCALCLGTYKISFRLTEHVLLMYIIFRHLVE